MQPIKAFDYADVSMVCEFLKLANGTEEAASVVVSFGMVSPWWTKGTEERV